MTKGRANTKATPQPLRNRKRKSSPNPKLIQVEMNTMTKVIIKTIRDMEESCACFGLILITPVVGDDRLYY